jgi:hypothetical protein
MVTGLLIILVEVAQAAIQPPVLGHLAEHNAEVTEARPGVVLPKMPTGGGSYEVSTAQQDTGSDTFGPEGLRQALPSESDQYQKMEQISETSGQEKQLILADVPPPGAEKHEAAIDEQVPAPIMQPDLTSTEGITFQTVTASHQGAKGAKGAKSAKGTKELKQQKAAERRREEMTVANEKVKNAAGEKVERDEEMEVAKLRKEKKRKGGQIVPGFGVSAVRAMRRKEKSDQPGS